MMRTLIVCVAAGLLALSGMACGGTESPASPSSIAAQAPQSTPGAAQGTPIGLTGVIRGLNLQSGSFSLVTRAATRLVRMDGDTQVWSRGARVRPATLRDGMTISIRGNDCARYVLARTISIN